MCSREATWSPLATEQARVAGGVEEKLTPLLRRDSFFVGDPHVVRGEVGWGRMGDGERGIITQKSVAGTGEGRS